MSKKHLVIVESPAKAKTIGKYLGTDYTVKACMGHLRDLPKSTIGVDIENDFTPEYKPIRGKEELIRELKKSAKESDTVYLATDPDREGEAISWHLQALLDLPEAKSRRVTFDEITRKVVTEAVANPRSLDMDLVDAQQARRILDRVVGYQISPIMWKKIRPSLSAGRVQSVATRMVDDRDRDIAEFVNLNAKQANDIDGSSGYKYIGMVNEGGNFSEQQYGSRYHWLPWCNFVEVDPASRLFDTFGGYEIAEIEELPYEERIRRNRIYDDYI